MESPASQDSCFLAEWYREELSDTPVGPTVTTLDNAAAEISALGTPVRLLAVLAVPTDSVLFGVFSAASAQIVAQACDRAGLSAQRLTPAAEVHLRAK
ncbi:hypothetical protein [Mycobacterium sp. 1081908.1]|uniref:hypothetical protein n=1 Tax=Mycobacterium sp. 1081908.1 TaxID=1834066 RepID=UPI0009EE61F9|nr:hypothetical protein [Mycobacterium sp. 1081908.1]